MNPTTPQPRILIIRGGALGDFVLTLPAIGLVRAAFPGAFIELLGYPHIAALGLGGGYVDAVRSVNYGPVAGFFAKNGTLDPALVEYFAGFQQVISYLYDPHRIFEDNMRRAGVKHYLAAFRQVTDRHAAREWASPLESLALFLEEAAARLELSPAARQEAREWLGGQGPVRLALHPGSGSESKNWPVAGWVEVGRRFLRQFPDGELVVVAGEADERVLGPLTAGLGAGKIRVAHGLPLLLLAGVLAECRFFAGHDTGVAHVAAAVGAQCVLLFGPTNPALWAPQNPGVRVLRAPESDWSRLTPGTVWRQVEALVGGDM
jgi:heptosyltransferase-2